MNFRAKIPEIAEHPSPTKYRPATRWSPWRCSTYQGARFLLLRPSRSFSCLEGYVVTTCMPPVWRHLDAYLR